MKDIYLVRHAQSQSQTGEDTDCLNPALSDRGLEQARRLVGPLGGMKFDRILVSPLRRAWQTFELSQAEGRRVQFDSRAIELYWGTPSYYGSILPVTTPDIAEPDPHDAWMHTSPERVSALCKDVCNGMKGSTVIFGHAGLLGHFIRLFAGLGFEEGGTWFICANASISHLRIEEGRRHIMYVNECCHVADLLE